MRRALVLGGLGAAATAARGGLPPAALRPGLKAFAAWALDERAGWEASRKRLALGLRLPGPPRGTEVRPTTVGGVPALEVRGPGATGDAVLLWLHGGGYVVGDAATYRPLTARVSQGFGGRAVVLDYRLAPEHPFPAALEDARAAYDALEAEVGASRIAVAGDSAGSGLTLALAQQLRADGAPLPAALGLMCPWLDLTADGARARPDAAKEPILTRRLIERFTEAYLSGGADPADPLVSPLKADLSGLPPVVVHTGGDDLLAPDGEAFAQRAREAGLHVEHTAYDGLWHDTALNAAVLTEPGRSTPRELGAALARLLARVPATA